VALEEKLQKIHDAPSSNAEAAPQSIADGVNYVPEFRSPHSVPMSEEREMNQSYSVQSTSFRSKRRKFNGD